MKKKKRNIITGKELVKFMGGPIKTHYNKPTFIPRGDGNGYLYYPDGTIQYVYIR